jgi:hypothetical protein
MDLRYSFDSQIDACSISSRYSPARLSLRKAGTHLLESTIGNKKAEAFMEGFNQFKSVATVTAKKKLDEFKEVINNSSPANRNGPFGYD